MNIQNDTWWDEDDHTEEEAKQKAAALDHSRLLNVHRWCDHPEANKFVNAIYSEHFRDRKAGIAKKHLKLILLDLYVAWCEDPKLKIVVSKSPNSYTRAERYNELHISSKTIDVINTLVLAGLIEEKIGFYNRHINFGRMSRIWPTQKLVELFQQALFSEFDIGYLEARSAIVLRKNDYDGDHGKKRKVDLDFQDDANTSAMEGVLKNYNALLHCTFIDIPLVDSDGHLEGETDTQKALIPSPHDKFVKRVFNRTSFEAGGRFFGGWWQRCPKEWRPHIYINDKPTNELDFSGLHIVMAYALEGICYWDRIGGDPYEVELFDFAEDYEYRRKITKCLMLMLLNAKTKKNAFKAFRKKAPANSAEKHLTDAQLDLIYQALTHKHEPIKDYFHSDMGIRLMHYDSQITESILATLTDKGIPALTLHDSYIVQQGHEDYLKELMEEKYEEVLGIPLNLRNVDSGSRDTPHIKEASERLEDLQDLLKMHYHPYGNQSKNYDEIESNYLAMLNPNKTQRYIDKYNKFIKYKNIDTNHY